jgi:hypothetical protein
MEMATKSIDLIAPASGELIIHPHDESEPDLQLVTINTGPHYLTWFLLKEAVLNAQQPRVKVCAGDVIGHLPGSMDVTNKLLSRPDIIPDHIDMAADTPRVVVGGKTLRRGYGTDTSDTCLVLPSSYCAISIPGGTSIYSLPAQNLITHRAKKRRVIPFGDLTVSALAGEHVHRIDGYIRDKVQRAIENSMFAQEALDANPIPVVTTSETYVAAAVAGYTGARVDIVTEEPEEPQNAQDSTCSGLCADSCAVDPCPNNHDASQDAVVTE